MGKSRIIGPSNNENINLKLADSNFILMRILTLPITSKLFNPRGLISNNETTLTLHKEFLATT